MKQNVRLSFAISFTSFFSFYSSAAAANGPDTCESMVSSMSARFARDTSFYARLYHRKDVTVQSSGIRYKVKKDVEK